MTDSRQTMPALERDSFKADEFDERDGLVADLPSRVVAVPTDLRHMAKKTWLFLSITTLLNIHNTIDGGATTRHYCIHSLWTQPSARPRAPQQP